MAQPINIEATLEGRLFQSLGSFWTTVFKETDKIRILTELALRTRVLGDFNRTVQNFAGDTKLAALTRHEFVHFEQNDVIETGMQVFDGPPPEDYGLSTDAPTVYDGWRIKYYALLLQDIIPVAIQCNDRQLLLGVDFFIQAGRYIYFRQDPREIFPTSGYLVVRGYEMNYRSYISYFTQTHAPGNDDLVVKYFRVSQTPQYFKLALAAIGQLGIIRYGGKLLAIATTDNSTDDVVYVFDKEAVRVSYQHEALVVGRVYEPLTIIGNVIQVLQADRKQKAWWRALNWRGGLVLDPIVPGYRGLPVVDNWVPAYNAGQDAGSSNGSKVHAQLRLGADFYYEQTYWDKVRANETANGFYLNSVIGLPNEAGTSDPTIPDTFAKVMEASEAANVLNFQLGLPPEVPSVGALPGTKLVNALDTFFQAVLDDVGYVIAFDQRQLQNQKEVFDFLTREMPVGCCPVIIGFVPNVIDDGDIFGDSIRVEETVSTADNLLVTVEEESNDIEWDLETVTVTAQFAT